MTASGPKPTLLALIVCDAVYRDSATGKPTLLGLFSNVNAKALPMTHQQLFVFVSLTDGHGRMEAELRLVNARTGEQVMSTKGNLEFANPLGVVEMIFDVRNLKIAEAGRYTFEFWCGDDLIAQRPFQVSLMSGEGQRRGE